MCKLGCFGSKLHPIALGLACGITKGLFLMLFAWTAMYWNYGLSSIALISEVYRGYEASFVGGFYGGAYGLVIGFVFGLLIAFIYNACAHCCGLCRTKGCGCGKEGCSCGNEACRCGKETCSCKKV